MDDMHKACIVCRDKDIFTKYIINGFHILQCNHCSLLFVGERLSQKELKTYYEKIEDDRVYDDSRNTENLKFYYIKLADLISKKMPIGKVLDVGCSAGHFLDSMQGWESYGIELDSRFAEMAKAKYGNNIHIGTLEDYECTQGYFDVITLQDALDHMSDPLQALTKCNALLKPGGLIIVKVHDISCFFAKLTGPKFYALIPPDHLAYFNRKNLTEALVISGFEVEESRYLAHLLFLKTALYRLSQNNKQNFFYWLYRVLGHSPLGDLKIKKNLNDIVTVFARKKR